MSTRARWGAIALGVLPDVIQVVPVAAWAVAAGETGSLFAYIVRATSH